jgi:hypothetical protein
MGAGDEACTSAEKYLPNFQNRCCGSGSNGRFLPMYDSDLVGESMPVSSLCTMLQLMFVLGRGICPIRVHCKSAQSYLASRDVYYDMCKARDRYSSAIRSENEPRRICCGMTLLKCPPLDMFPPFLRRDHSCPRGWVLSPGPHGCRPGMQAFPTQPL